MTKLKRMDIALVNPQTVYFPGQVIQGQLIIELSADMKMRGIRIKCKGKGHVYWTTGSGDDKKTYSASEEYVDNALVLYGKSSYESGEVILAAGNHVFPFQFVLPVDLPGSFEGPNRSKCYVRYWLKGTIDKPWKFDPECKVLFTVGSCLDLNTIQGASASTQSSDSKTVCCCCCETDPITATFRIDKTGYVPGEAIVCDAEINENTGRGVNSTKLKLIQKTTYRTHGGSTKKDYLECARLQHGPITPGGTDVFAGERLQIPALPSSYLRGCSIIDIDYKVELIVDVADTMFDLNLESDIIIGTIPLRSVVEQYIPQYQQPTAPLLPGQEPVMDQPMGFGPPLAGFSPPPPSYQECMHGKVDTTDDDDKHTSGNMNYAPAYPYYDWMNPPKLT